MKITSPILLPGAEGNTMDVNPTGVHVVCQAQQFCDAFQRMYEYGDNSDKDPLKHLRSCFPHRTLRALDRDHGDGVQLLFVDYSRCVMYSNEPGVIYVFKPGELTKGPAIT
jgi:hypothetical protein